MRTYIQTWHGKINKYRSERRMTDKGRDERKSRCIYKFDADGFQRQNRPVPERKNKTKREKERKEDAHCQIK